MRTLAFYDAASEPQESSVTGSATRNSLKGEFKHSGCDEKPWKEYPNARRVGCGNFKPRNTILGLQYFLKIRVHRVAAGKSDEMLGV